MPKVSIIIPTYNVESYLRECLDSVINQTLNDIEIICVNDGSTDGSLAILEEYAGKDSRIILINQQNRGQATARNAALKIAKGEYILFLDSDDYLAENTSEHLYRHAKEKTLDMLLFNGVNFNNSTREFLNNPYWDIKPYLEKDQDYSVFKFSKIQHIAHKLPVSACLVLYRLNFITHKQIKFPDGLFFEDNLFFTKSLTQAENIGISFAKFYFRRLHSEQTTQNYNKYFKDYLEIVDLVLIYLKSIKINKTLFHKYKMTYLSHCQNRYESFDAIDQEKYEPQLSSLLKKYHYSSKNQNSFFKKSSSQDGKKITSYIGGIVKKVKSERTKKVYLFGLAIWHKKR